MLELEKAHPELASPDSPTQRVGGEPLERFKKVEHRAPMLSLANAFSEEELRAFNTRISKLLERDEIAYVTEMKIDGVAMAKRGALCGVLLGAMGFWARMSPRISGPSNRFPCG